ncbi:hypothetical protein IMZ48_37610 [Candidatus Bathyarchaeota archaeon]|nr:hypothetical protein [Candidatus Bathyarchaeota archaeon]
MAQRNPELRDNEVNQYQSCRYIGPNEAGWRSLGYPTNEQDPPVITLAVHTPDNQPVTFRPDENQDDLADRLRLSRSHLTAFFELNQYDPSARDLLYNDIPSTYVWERQQKIVAHLPPLYICSP